MCASSGSMVAPSVARISSKCGVRTRKADARWCICGPRGRARVAELLRPLCPFVPPLSPPCIHTYIHVGGVCELSMVEQRFVLCAEGVLQ